MLERLRQIPTMLLEFWNKYTSKQKTIIICVVAAVIFTLAVMIALLSRTRYVQLDAFETTKEASQAKTLLEENGISVRASGADATVLSVDKKKLSDAKLLLGANGISADSAKDYSSLFDNSMSTTDSERKLKEKLFLQDSMEKTLKGIDGVKTAAVTIYMPNSTNSIYKDEKESTVSIMLSTNDEFTKDASTIASWAANQIGSSLESVRILDQTGKMLYSGESIATSGNATAALEVKSQVEYGMSNSLRNVLTSSGYYNDAQVAANLDVQLSDEERHNLEYYSNDTDDTGPLGEKYTYEAENVEGIENLTGTDANGENITDVDLLTGGRGNSTVTVNRITYNTSYTETKSITSVGEVHLDNSSIAVVLNHFVVYDEKLLEEAGELADKSFEQFKAENGEPKLADVDPGIVTLIANATGIKEASISVVAYDVPVFYDKGESAFNFENIIQIVLALMIVGLILFVVFKGMKPVEVVELEPELSVEQLLATTKENQTLDDIEFSEKSATRTQIEKFVDENPEAVAILLRNWLNDDWE